MNYNLEIQKSLLELEKQSAIEDKIRLLKPAIQLADANNDLDWGYDLRLRLVHYEGLTANTLDSFPAFAWLLDTSRSEPDLCNSLDLLYKYKWMVHASFDHLGISLKQIKDILFDYLQRSIDYGYSRRSYYDMEISWSLFTGDSNRAKKFLEYRNTEPVDSLTSHTEKMTDICVYLLDGDIEKAISVSNEFLVQNPEEKGPTYCMLVYYATMNGDSRVEDFFREADEQLSKVDKYPYMLFDISQLMYYLAKNNQEKAWEYFEKYAHWELDANDYYSFDFSLSIIPLLKDGGNRTLQLSPRFPFYSEEGVYDVNKLYRHYMKKVETFAPRFDERNGNNYFTMQIENYLL